MLELLRSHQASRRSVLADNLVDDRGLHFVGKIV
jgi:hypothetical protein